MKVNNKYRHFETILQSDYYNSHKITYTHNAESLTGQVDTLHIDGVKYDCVELKTQKQFDNYINTICPTLPRVIEIARRQGYSKGIEHGKQAIQEELKRILNI